MWRPVADHLRANDNSPEKESIYKNFQDLADEMQRVLEDATAA
jgi:hypothetical protein